MQAVGNIQVVPVEQATYVLGRVTVKNLPQVKNALPTQTPVENSIGLFTASGLRPLQESFKTANESVENAVERLRPRLKAILASQLLTAMTGSDVATISRNPDLKVSVDIVPVTGSSGGGSANLRIFKMPPGAKSAQAELRVVNNDKRNLYVAVLSFNSNGSLSFLYPPKSNEPEIAALLGKGKAAPSRAIVLTPPAGFVELMTLVSTEPVRDMLLALQRIAETSQLSDGSPITVRGEDSLSLFADLLNGLDNNTRSGITLPRDVAVVNKKQFTAVSTIVQIVE